MPPILPPGFTLLQVTPRLVGGGVERATLDMAGAVTKSGFRSIVASGGGVAGDELQGELIRLPVHSRNPAVMLANVGRLTRLIRELDVSVVHVRSRAPAFSAIAAARRAGVPVVATYHGIYAAKAAPKRWYNGVMTRGDLVIANSNFTRDHILSQHPISPDRVIVVPEGIDTDRFDPAAVTPDRIAAVRRAWELGGDDSRRVVLCAARLTAWKGQGTAIEAFAGRARRENAVLVLAGRVESEVYATALRGLADRLGVTGSVKLVGTLEDMPAAFMTADVVLAPSVQAESFGRGVVEAGAMERFVIASALGAHRETVLDGETGWLAPPGDVAGWTRALDCALTTPAGILRGMGRRARQRVVGCFGLDAMAEATFQAYRRLLSSSQGGER